MAKGKKVKVQVKPSPESVAKLNRAMKDLQRVTGSKISKEVGRAVLAIDRGAKRRTPVDTGRLRSGFEIDWRNGEITGRVLNQVEYAPDVEFGTGAREGVFMLTNAFNEELPKFKKRIERVLKNLK